MKLRGAWGNAVKFISLAALCGVVLWTVKTGASKRQLVSSNKSQAAEASRSNKPTTVQETQRLAAAYGKLPLTFEENVGQTAREVRYVSHDPSYELFLTQKEAVLALPSYASHTLSPIHRGAFLQANREARKAALTAVRLRLEGANPNPQMMGLESLPTKINYFIGNDPQKWHTDVPSFARVKYKEVYPGVDLVFYGNQRRLEYDFVVAPGADPGAIRLKIDGAQKMRVNPQGDVVLSVTGGEVTLQKPLIYQQVNGAQREIAGNYLVSRNHRVSFSVASYDHSAPLILDPVLNYSTYLGGTGNDGGFAIALDAAGDAFIAGQTASTDFPAGTHGAVAPSPAANMGASFVAELNAAGTQLLYSTYLAGTASNAFEQAFGVAVDTSGKVYVTGLTFATDFPTTANALKGGTNAGNVNGTSYLAKLDPTLSGATSLLYSSYIGGTNGTAALGGDLGQAIAVDSSNPANGIAYVAGYTDSTPGTAIQNFPVVNGFQTTLNCTNGNAFLAKIDTTKSGTASLIYSTYLGGTCAHSAAQLNYGEDAFGVAVDTSGKAYLAGTTSSTDFPTFGNAHQPNLPTGNALGTAFLTEIDTTQAGAASQVYSTYLGGATLDEATAIALGPGNVAYITGTTNSNNFPVTTGAFDTSGAGGGKAFVTLIDTTLPAVPSLKYSTFLGGSGGDIGRGIRADGSGNAYVVGTTSSSNFPLPPGPLQSALLDAHGNAFIAKLNPAGGGASDLLYATYYGGSGDGTNADQGFAIGIDSASPPNAYITGQTFSTNLPVLSALSTGGSRNGPSDAYVAKLALIPTLAIAPSPFNFGTQAIGVTSAPQAFQVTNNTASGVTFSSIVVNGVSPAANTDFTKSSDGCSPSVAAGAPPCTVNVTFKPSVTGAESATLVITAVVTNGGQASTDVFNVSLTGTGATSAPGVGLAPTTLNFGNQAVSTTSAPMAVTLTNTGNASLTINTIAASGDFAETSTGATVCPISPATLAAGANCTINVTFTPTATGARNGTLTITDNASGSPHTVALTGTGTGTADFTLSAAPTTLTVAQGAVGAAVTITVNPTNGFASAVALACTGAPANSSCVLSPTSITPPTTSALTFTAHAMLVPVSRPTPPPFNLLRIVPLFVALMLIFVLRSTQRLRTRVAMVTAILFCVTLAACSGTGGPAKTAKGAYTLTITGTSGTLSHNTTVAITVN